MAEQVAAAYAAVRHALVPLPEMGGRSGGCQPPVGDQTRRALGKRPSSSRAREKFAEVVQADA